MRSTRVPSLATRWTSRVLTLGLLLALSQGAVASHEAGGDFDRDGVPDSEDWCLGTAPGVPVDAHGCPVAAIGSWRDTELCEVGPGGPHRAGMDVDVDGVPDSDDWCSDPGRLGHP